MFICKISFLRIFKIILVGNTIPRYIIKSIIGEVIFPKSSPNFIHNLLKGVKNFEFKIPKIKKKIAGIIKYKFKLLFFLKYIKVIIRKKRKNIIPKLLFELRLIFFHD